MNAEASSGQLPFEVTTLGQLLDQRVQASADRTAIVTPHERVTFGELGARAEFYGRALLGLGIDSGDNVGILMPTLVDFIAAMFGAVKIGAVPVLMNARFKARELRHVITNGDLRAVLTSSNVSDIIDFPALLVDALPSIDGQDGETLRVEDAPKLRHLVLVDDDTRPGFIGTGQLRDAAASADPSEIARRQSQATIRDVAMIMYTSGTTASPKGAMLTHEGLVRQALTVAETRYFLNEDDVLWTPMPLFHIGGWGYVVTCIATGCKLVHAGHFDADTSLAQLADEGCTVALPAFETMWLQILDHPDFESTDLSAIRLVMAVGVAESLQRMQDRFPQAPLVSTFGGTESSSHLSIALADDHLRTRMTTGGHALPGIDVKIIDVESQQPAKPGAPGEIQYRGWNRFVGYYNEPELTAEVIDDEGWFHSGDIGTMDDEGRVTFVGRLKDMLKVGGENVAAAEIEGYLIGHEAVQIVQVVAAPDAHYTEVPAAFVELKPGRIATEDELIDFCRGEIATFKVPRYIRFIDDWPMSGTKIKKYVLRDQLAAELEDAGITEAPRIRSR